ncbi:glycerophosphoryl diester phosphodiesterase [Paenibacillus glycanilyticus]|uniref:Glycerophosphoryl diester phosphodiesterase n=1 Tax=Paenibacillus glycanilyticus TaxID=126569 RepID=A0ABQ6NKK1_9BACL|nr:glycerophosphodiester phosphodiesterase [Paenibacillus glycanilyticus]GMK45064.1 glycerophosphoryl diester phosphodiesterase [Paenibacillus glycanilyticus]
MTTLVNYAHRGASGNYPENTMIAFEKAIELGATGIETDVQMTKDGKLVLIHDEMLRRTTGVNTLVADMPSDELLQLDAGSWFSPSFKDARIPTLGQLLDLANRTGTIINIELKNGIVPYPGLEQKVIETVRACGMENQVILSSFNHYSLIECKRLAPEIRTGILYMEGLYRPWKYALSIGASALHASHFAVLPDWVAEAAQHGVIYNVFTVNEPAEMKRLIQAGVAGIITDYPERLTNLLNKL